MRDSRLDACLTLVSNRHRRKIIQQLRYDATGETMVAELIDQLHTTDSIPVTDQYTGRDQLTTQLIHIHLPKLADYGVIEIDPERNTIWYQPDKQLEAVLDPLPEEAVQANA